MNHEDKFHDECGVFGISHHPDASRHTYLGLYSLQHRGQESAGISSSDGVQLYWQRGMGLVADVFDDRRLSRLTGENSTLLRPGEVLLRIGREPTLLVYFHSIPIACSVRLFLESDLNWDRDRKVESRFVQDR